MNTAPILVIGSTGKTGSRIVRSLTKKAFPVREGSRSSAIPFDWESPKPGRRHSPASRRPMSPISPISPFPALPQKIEALTKAATQCRCPQAGPAVGQGRSACRAIARRSYAIAVSISPWSAPPGSPRIFRKATFRRLFLTALWRCPPGDIKEPIADVDDIADVAVAALTDDRHNGELYEITGPRLLTFAEAAAEISSAAGIPVRYMPITLEQFHAGMLEIGGPLIADVFTEICRETLDGHNAYLTDGVQRALGREPRDFADFCRDAAASGVWKQAA
jgi:nucleoside-diphosphate-sugar epimerase